MIFEDTEGDKMEVRCCGDGRKVAFEVEDADVFYFNPSDARAIAAEIIACADRIEGKEAAGPPRAELVPVVTHVTNIAPASTPTHTSHTSPGRIYGTQRLRQRRL